MANPTTAHKPSSSLGPSITNRVAKLVREMDSLRSALEEATITKSRKGGKCRKLSCELQVL